MPYISFTIAQVKRQFQIEVVTEPFFRDLPTLTPGEWLTTLLAKKDFFGRELEADVSIAAIESFLQLPEREAIGHVLNYRGQLLSAGLAAATVNARLAALRSFVIHAYKRKLCNFRLDDIKSVKAQSYKDTRGISTAVFRRASFACDLNWSFSPWSLLH